MADQLIRIRLTGDAEADHKLQQLELFLNDLRTFWPLLVPLFIGWMGAQFASEGGWSGHVWAPLSPGYAIEKARTHPGRTILIRDGAMRQAASRPLRTATPRTLTLTIDDPKAGYHQEGTDRMPARPLIPDRLPVSAVRDVERAGETYVSTLIRRLGL